MTNLLTIDLDKLDAGLRRMYAEQDANKGHCFMIEKYEYWRCNSAEDYEKEIAALNGALQAMKSDNNGWRDISTAPRDGTLIAIYSPEFSETPSGGISYNVYWKDGPKNLMGWYKNNCMDCFGQSATMWRPILTGPKGSE